MASAKRLCSTQRHRSGWLPVVQDLLVKFLQQPLPALIIEKGCQPAFLSLLQFATQDAQLLCKGREDFSWVMDFKEPYTVWWADSASFSQVSLFWPLNTLEIFINKGYKGRPIGSIYRSYTCWASSLTRYALPLKQAEIFFLRLDDVILQQDLPIFPSLRCVATHLCRFGLFQILRGLHCCDNDAALICGDRISLSPKLTAPDQWPMPLAQGWWTCILTDAPAQGQTTTAYTAGSRRHLGLPCRSEVSDCLVARMADGHVQWSSHRYCMLTRPPCLFFQHSEWYSKISEGSCRIAFVWYSRLHLRFP